MNTPDFNRLVGRAQVAGRLLGIREELAGILAQDMGCSASHVALMDVLPLLWNVALGRDMTDRGAAFGISDGIMLVPGQHAFSRLPHLTGMGALIRRVSRRKTAEYLPRGTVPTELLARKIAWRAFACAGRRRGSLGVLFVHEPALSRLKELLFAVVAPITPRDIWGTAAKRDHSGADYPYLQVYTLPEGAIPICLWSYPVPPAIVHEPVAFPGPVLSLVPYGDSPPEYASPFTWSPFFHLEEPPPPWISVFASPLPSLPPSLGI